MRRLCSVLLILLVLALAVPVSLQAADPAITTEKTVFSFEEDIEVSYTGTDTLDWIGVYPIDGVPGGPASLLWSYSDDGEGSVVFPRDTETKNTYLAPGKYKILLCDNNGYDILSRIDIEIVEAPITDTEMTPKALSIDGDTVSITPHEGVTSALKYELYWADAKGRIANYTAVKTFKHEGADSFTVKLNDRLYAPDGAEKLCVRVTADETDGFASCSIPETMKLKDSELLYSFNVLTDIHIRNGSDDSDLYNIHFKNALNDIVKNDPDSLGIFTVGDNTDNGYKQQYDMFFKIADSVLKDTGIGITLTIGNHDYSGNFDTQLEQFNEYAGRDKVYGSIAKGNVRFIQLGSEKAGNAYITDEQFDMLTAQLEEAKAAGGIAFITLHQPLINTTSGSLAAVDPVIQDWYGVVQDTKLRTLLDKYPNAILFTGHTHWTFDELQPILYGKGTGATYINSGAVSYLWDDFDQNVDGSQGLYVEVYSDYVLIKAKDFDHDKWMAAAQFAIPIKSSYDPSEATPPPATDAKSTSKPGSTPNVQSDKSVVIYIVVCVVAALAVTAVIAFAVSKKKKNQS